MKKKRLGFNLIVLTLITLVFQCCNKSTSDSSYTIPQGQYAQGFILNEHDSYIELLIFNPWEKGTLMGHYILVNDSTPETDIVQWKADKDVSFINVPIKRLAATSCTHVGFLEALNETNSLCGICTPQIVYTPIPEDCIDLGDAMQINIERLLLAQPDALMLNTYSQNDAMKTYLEKTDINIIYNNEWTEQSPLGRAEWIKVIGVLYGKSQKADSIFNKVENDYLDLQKKVKEQITTRRTLMAGNNFRGTWYMPSGKVYTGQLYCDAGADYYLQNDSSNNSLPLSIENVLLHFRDADVWVNSTYDNLKDLSAADGKHTWFKAYQNREVYNFSARSTSSGANDFWETGVVHPERILQDLVWVLYPTLMPNYEPYYTKRLD